jgi:hypothetical protein
MSNSICDRDFSLTTADFLYASDNPFPVEFDLAWQWLGYAHKRDYLEIILCTIEIKRRSAIATQQTPYIQ